MHCAPPGAFSVRSIYQQTRQIPCDVSDIEIRAGLIQAFFISRRGSVKGLIYRLTQGFCGHVPSEGADPVLADQTRNIAHRGRYNGAAGLHGIGEDHWNAFQARRNQQIIGPLEQVRGLTLVQITAKRDGMASQPRRT